MASKKGDKADDLHEQLSDGEESPQIADPPINSRSTSEFHSFRFQFSSKLVMSQRGELSLRFKPRWYSSNDLNHDGIPHRAYHETDT